MVERKSHIAILPSQGKFNPEIPEGIVEVYPIRVLEEKMMAGMSGTGTQRMNALFKSCLKSEVDPSKLLLVDRMYLLLFLRILSYGPSRKVTIPCQSCGQKNDYNMDLNSFEITNPKEDQVEPFSITLPISGDVIELRFLRGIDEQEISQASERYRKKGKSPSEIAFVMQMTLPVVSVNGEVISELDKFAWADNLVGQDASFLRKSIESTDFGVKMESELTCSNCQEEFTAALPMEEFFRIW